MSDVLEVLTPIWMDRRETGRRLRGRIERVLDAAKAEGLREGQNPATWRGLLEYRLPRLKKADRKHHPALPHQQAPAFMAALRDQNSIAALALQFAILTACRSGEVRGAVWGEIDITRAVWTIPGSRMKAGVEHVVPLSQACVDILMKVKALRDPDNGDFVFPGSKPGRPLSDMALVQVLRRMNRSDIVPHGFRSTFRDWASEVTSFPHQVCEMALAHTIGNEAEAAYRRGNLLPKRRELMAAWDEHLSSKITTGGESNFSATN